MARIRYTHNSFSTGVISKKVLGNTDFEGYNNAMSECVNFLVQPTGGVFKRPGTVFVTEALSEKSRLVVYSYSVDDQFICEFVPGIRDSDTHDFTTKGKIRFFSADGAIIKNPQNTNEELVLETEFDSDDIKQMLTFQDGATLILRMPAGFFSLDCKQPEGNEDQFTFELSENPLPYETEPLTFSNINKNLYLKLKAVPEPGNPYVYVASSNDMFSVDDKDHILCLTYRRIIDEQTGQLTDKSYYFQIKNIDTSGDNTELSVQLDGILNNVTELPESVLDTSLEVTKWQVMAFNSKRGSPEALAYHEGRLFLAATTQYPTGIWGSSKFFNDWSDFYCSSNDADGMQFKMSALHADKILWLAANSKLFAGTGHGIFIAGNATSSASAITPSNFSMIQFTSIGTIKLQPVSALDSLFFIDSSKRGVHEISLNAESMVYQSECISLLSSDLMASGIIAHTWQQTPIQVYWCATEDGYLCALTYQKAAGIMAWTKHVIAGNNVKVEQLVTMHGEKSDLVWMIVRREVVNSLGHKEFKRYIEYLHAPYDPLSKEEFKQFYVDCGKSQAIQLKIENVNTNVLPVLVCTAQTDHANHIELINSAIGKYTPAIFKWYSSNQEPDNTPLYQSGQMEVFVRYRTNGEVGCNVYDCFTDNNNYVPALINESRWGSFQIEGYEVFLFVRKFSAIESSHENNTVTITTDTTGFAVDDQIILKNIKNIDQYGDDASSIQGIILIITQIPPDSRKIIARPIPLSPDRGALIPTVPDLEPLNTSGEIYLNVCRTTNNNITAKLNFEVEVLNNDDSAAIQPGDRIYINNVPGMTQLNDRSYTVLGNRPGTTVRRLSLADDELTQKYVPQEADLEKSIPLDGRDFSPLDTVVKDKGNVYLYFDKVTGLEHLKGQEVVACIDGNNGGTYTVADDGSIDLQVPAMYCSVGLPITSYMRTTPFSGGSLLGSSVGTVGGQKNMWMHVFYSLGGKYGADDDSVYPIPYQNFISKLDCTRTLETGLIKCPIVNSRDIYNRSIYIEHSDPVAFNILSITQDMDISDS